MVKKKMLKRLGTVATILFLATFAYASAPVGFKGNFLNLGPWVPSTVPNSSIFLDSTNGNAFTLKNASGGLAVVQAGGSSRTTNTVSSSFTVPALTADYILNVNTMSGNVSVTLPDATAANGFCVDVKNVSVNIVTVTPPGSQTIDGFSFDTVEDQNDSKHYCAVGGNWFNY